MPKFTIEESQSAFHPPYREVVFSHTDNRYFFTIFEDHKEIFRSSFYKDQDDCAERGALYLENLHQQKPLYQEQSLPVYSPARVPSHYGKSQFNG